METDAAEKAGHRASDGGCLCSPEARGPFHYAPLPAGDGPVTRMLRLLPSADEHAAVECILLDGYVLEPLREQHMYDALSYAWGGQQAAGHIHLNGLAFPVTANLDAALRHLRGRLFERILWVDAICINQQDKEEKALQVRHMAHVYGFANRVLVWLGPSADGSDEALSEMQAAAEDIHEGRGRGNRESARHVVELLKRPWFRRVWVLQEVALARQITLVCGYARISGRAFCGGISRFFVPGEEGVSELGTWVKSVTYLINGADYRPRYTGHPTSLFSLAELIDMYHDREASLPEDRVYGLLGLSGGAGSATPDLYPDYGLSNQEFMARVLASCLGPLDQVRTSMGSQRASFGADALPLGVVTSVRSRADRYDQQCVSIAFGASEEAHRHRSRWGDTWVLPSPAKAILRGDIVCLVNGDPVPMLVRACDDYGFIIMTKMNPQHGSACRDMDGGASERSSGGGGGQRSPTTNIVLVWDWDTLAPEAHPQDSLRELLGTAPPPGSPEAMQRQYSMASFLNDAGLRDQARQRLGNLDTHRATLGLCHPLVISCMDLLASTHVGDRDWAEAIDVTTRTLEAREEALGRQHEATRSALAALAGIHVEQVAYAFDVWDMMALLALVDGIRSNDDVTEADMVRVIRCGSGDLLAVLLRWKQGHLPLTSKVIKTATEPSTNASGQVTEGPLGLLLRELRGDVFVEDADGVPIVDKCPPSVLILLLHRVRGRFRVTRSVVRAAVERERRRGQGDGLAMLKVLLGATRHRFVLPLTEEAAVEMALSRHHEMASLLRHRLGDDACFRYQSLTSMVSRLRPSPPAPLLLLQLFSQGNPVPLPAVLEATLHQQRRRGEAPRLAGWLEQHGKDAPPLTASLLRAIMQDAQNAHRTLELLGKASGNALSITDSTMDIVVREGTVAMLSLFWAHRRPPRRVTQDLIRLAAGNVCDGGQVTKFLLDRHQQEEPTRVTPSFATDDVLQTALVNSRYGSMILHRLLESGSIHKPPVISEEVLTWAARRDARFHMRELLDAPDARLDITPDVVEATLSPELLRLLYERLGPSFPPTHYSVIQCARLLDEAGLRGLLDRAQDGIRVTDGLVDALSSNNEFRGVSLARFLSQGKPRLQITERGLSQLIEHSRLSDLDAALRQLDSAAALTGNAIRAMMRRRRSEPMMSSEEDLLLRGLGGSGGLLFTDDAAATLLTTCGPDDLPPPFLDQLGSGLCVTRQMLDGVAANEHHGVAILQTIVSRCGSDRRTVALALLRAALQGVSNLEAARAPQLRQSGSVAAEVLSLVEGGMQAPESRHLPVLTSILRQFHAAALASEEVAAAEVRLQDLSLAIGCELLEALLGCGGRDDDALVSESSMMANVEHWNWSSRLETIHRCRGDRVAMTDNVIRSAILSDANGNRRDKLAKLLAYWGHRMPLTESCVQFMHDDYDTAAKLLSACRLDQPISEHLAMEMARWLSAMEARDLVSGSESSGHRARLPIPLTRRVVRALGRRSVPDKALLMDLLNDSERDGNAPPPRPEIMVEVAKHFDEELMERVIDQWADDDLITAPVVLAATHNRRSAGPLVEHLLGRQVGDAGEVSTGALMEAAMAGPALDVELFRHLLRLRPAIPMSAPLAIHLLEQEMARATPHPDEDYRVRAIVTCYLADEDSRPTDEVLCMISLSGDEEQMTAAAHRHAAETQLTAAVVGAAARRAQLGGGSGMLDTMVSLVCDGVPITDEGLAQAARKAALFCDEDVIRRLLAHVQSPAVRESVWVAMLSRQTIVSVRPILDEWATSIPISREVVEAAAKSPCPESAVLVKRLLSHADARSIHEDILLPVVRHGDKGLVRLVLDRVTEDGTLTIPIDNTKILEAAARNEHDARPILHLLLDRLSGKAHRAGQVWKAAAVHPRAEEILTRLLVEGGGGSGVPPPSEDVMEALAGNRHGGTPALSLVASHFGAATLPVTERVLEASAAAQASLVFVCARWPDVRVTDRVLAAALAGAPGGTETIWGTLLARRRRQDPAPVGEQVVVAAVCGPAPDRQLQLLLDVWGGDTPVTEGVLRAVDRGRRLDLVLRLLLDQWTDSFPVDGRVVARIMAERGTDRILMIRLLDKFALPVSDAIMSAAARNEHTEMMPCVWDRWSAPPEVPSSVVDAAAGNGREALERLVGRWGDRVGITAQTVTAAACGAHGEAVLEFMREEWGPDLPVTVEAMVAAASNQQCHRVMTLFARLWPTKISPTGQVLHAAAGNPAGMPIVLRIVWAWGTGVPLTETIVAAAVGSSSWREMLGLLFERWGTAGLSCTDTLVRAADECKDGHAIKAYLRQQLGG